MPNYPTLVFQISCDSHDRLRTKSPAGSKFSKIFFPQLYTGWIVVVHLYCGFFCGIRWHHNNAKSWDDAFVSSFFV